MKMGTLVAAIVSATVSIILIGTVLAPQVATFTGQGGALADYSGILSAVVVISIVAVLMLGVRLITTRD